MADETPPNATVYVRNLDERVKIPALIEALRDIFGEFGTILDVVAKRNLKAKGQAFVVFESAEAAQDAIDALQGFDLFERPMTLAFAKTRSDATVAKEDGDAGLEAHKAKRLAEKERKQAAEAAEKEAAAKSAKRAAPDALADRPAKASKPAAGVVPDEYLPPNKILVLREFPETYGKDALSAVFARFPGFKEVRLVPGRAGLAFAEYVDEAGATAAKEAMHGRELGGKSLRVTYQKG